MRHPIRALLCSAILSLGCTQLQAAEQPLPNPILNPGSPWIFAGFSVNTPAEEGWVSFQRDGRSAALGKNSDDAKHIYGVNVLVETLAKAPESAQELVDQLTKNRPTLVDVEEYSIQKRTESPTQINGQWCSQYTVNANAKKDKEFPHLFIQGLSCANPANPRMVVDVAASDITPEEEMALKLFPLAEQMMKSVKFTTRISKQDTDALGKKLAASDIKGAIDMLQPRAEAGDSRAAFLLADIYINAKDNLDYAQARKWLEMSAAQGERDALYQLGVLYDKALGVPRDLKQAVKWFTLAADQRDSQAQLNLGILHDPRADGFAKDINIAANWLVLSANNGNQRAKQLLEKQYKRQAPGEKEQAPKQ